MEIFSVPWKKDQIMNFNAINPNKEDKPANEVRTPSLFGRIVNVWNAARAFANELMPVQINNPVDLYNRLAVNAAALDHLSDDDKKESIKSAMEIFSGDGDASEREQAGNLLLEFAKRGNLPEKKVNSVIDISTKSYGTRKQQAANLLLEFASSELITAHERVRAALCVLQYGPPRSAAASRRSAVGVSAAR